MCKAGLVYTMMLGLELWASCMLGKLELYKLIEGPKILFLCFIIKL